MSSDLALLSSLIADVIPYLAGSPAPRTLARAISRSWQAFCRDTACWVETLDGIPVDGGVREYTLPVPDSYCAGASSLRSVLQGGACWDKGLTRLLPGDVLQLARDPRPEGGELVATVTLVPHADSGVAPVALLGRWRVAITDGALADLLMLPKEPWTDQSGAAFFATRRRQAVCDANLSRVTEGRGEMPQLHIPRFV